MCDDRGTSVRGAKQHGYEDLASPFYNDTDIVKRVSWFKSSLLLSIKTVDITNINS